MTTGSPPAGTALGTEGDGGAWPLAPALLAWALLAGLCAAPYARAALRPPPGHTFVGTFYYVEDVYNYLGYAQQAEDGAFLFRNKLTLEPHGPALINVEWWLVGRLSALLGGRMLLAWRVVGLLASLPFVLLIDAWLRRAGIPPGHRLPALLLVLLGGGLGGLFNTLGWPRALNPLDMSTGLFPFVELLANPHFVCGSALLMGALLLLFRGGARSTAGGVALAGLAGLVRPYDMVMIVMVFGLTVVLTEPRRAVRRLLPLLGLLPVVVYVGWVFYVNTAYRVFGAEAYERSWTREIAYALAPGLLVALATRSWRTGDTGQRRARVLLGVWLTCAVLIGVLRPVTFSLQFMVGVGVPLLGLAALGLTRFPAWVTAASILLLGSSAATALRVWTAGEGPWFVPRARLESARALGAACHAGEVAMAPPDIGLYALAFAPCSPYVSHPVMQDAARHAAEAVAFYGAAPPAARAAFLDARSIAAVLLPRDAPVESALGRDTPFRRADGGRAQAGFDVYRRSGR